MMIKKILLLTGIALSTVQAMEPDLALPEATSRVVAPAPLEPAFWGQNFGISPGPTISLERDITAYYVAEKQKLETQIRGRFGDRNPAQEIHALCKSEKFDESAYRKLLQEVADYQHLTLKYQKYVGYADTFCDVNGLIKEMMNGVHESSVALPYFPEVNIKEINEKNIWNFPFMVNIPAVQKKVDALLSFLRKQAKIYIFFRIKDFTSLEQEKTNWVTLLCSGKDDEQLKTVQKLRSTELEEKFSSDAMKTAIFVMEEFAPGFLSTIKAVQRTAKWMPNQPSKAPYPFPSLVKEPTPLPVPQ